MFLSVCQYFLFERIFETRNVNEIYLKCCILSNITRARVMRAYCQMQTKYLDIYIYIFARDEFFETYIETNKLVVRLVLVRTVKKSQNI